MNNKVTICIQIDLFSGVAHPNKNKTVERMVEVIQKNQDHQDSTSRRKEFQTVGLMLLNFWILTL